jgi:endoglucanase
VRYGQQHAIHVNLNFHRGPGYCVNPPAERLNLWKDTEAQDAMATQWAQFARRYKGIPNTELSFDLLNEPAHIDEPTYVGVMKAVIEAIRAEDPERLIIVDGLEWGNRPVPGLKEMQVAQSGRGYAPSGISHYKASWVTGSDTWPEPTWPLQQEGVLWDKEKLREKAILPWQELTAQGVGVHIGEWGCYQVTPHPVSLAWMQDFLELWQEAGFGWALWNFRGSFGVLDSGRKDVTYEEFRGHQLDRKMLTLLQRY